MPGTEPRGGLEASKTTAYRVGAAGMLGVRVSDTIVEAVKHSIEDELQSLPPALKHISNLAKMAISSIPGAKNNPLGGGLFTIAGFITKEKEDISNDELLKNIREEMKKMKEDILKMFKARPYAELATALELFERFRSQGVGGDGLKWLKDAERLMNVNLHQLMELMLVNPGSHEALDMLSHVVTQGQIYMSILDTLCSVDPENAPGYTTTRKNFGNSAASAIRVYFSKWREYIPFYVQRKGGAFGLIGPFGFEVKVWSDWLGSNRQGEWITEMSSSHGWKDSWVDDPMSSAHLNIIIDNFLRNRTDLFGPLQRLIATADMFEKWAK